MTEQTQTGRKHRTREDGMHPSPIPKGVLPFVFALVFFTLTVVSVAVLMDGKPQTAAVPANAEDVAWLTFDQRSDGSIAVTSPEGTSVLPSGEHGFIRGALRALNRQRYTHEVPADTPFALVREESGRVLLSDPATGAVVDLRAFGADNLAAFAQLLPAHAAAKTGGSDA